jgi:hypothetical protein
MMRATVHLVSAPDFLAVRPISRPPGNGRTIGTYLVDGYFRSTWAIGGGTLGVTPFGRLERAARNDIAEEGARLLVFTAAGAGVHDVRIQSGQ